MDQHITPNTNTPHTSLHHLQSKYKFKQTPQTHKNLYPAKPTKQHTSHYTKTQHTTLLTQTTTTPPQRPPPNTTKQITPLTYTDLTNTHRTTPTHHTKSSHLTIRTSLTPILSSYTTPSAHTTLQTQKIPTRKRKATKSPELEHSQTTPTCPQPREFTIHFPPHSWKPPKQPWNVKQNNSQTCTQIYNLTHTYRDLQHLSPNPTQKTNHWIDTNKMDFGLTLFHKKSPFVTQRTQHTPSETKIAGTTPTLTTDKCTNMHKTTRKCANTLHNR